MNSTNAFSNSLKEMKNYLNKIGEYNENYRNNLYFIKIKNFYGNDFKKYLSNLYLIIDSFKKESKNDINFQEHTINSIKKPLDLNKVKDYCESIEKKNICLYIEPLFVTIKNIILSTNNEFELQNELLNILGYNNLDFIILIIQNIQNLKNEVLHINNQANSWNNVIFSSRKDYRNASESNITRYDQDNLFFKDQSYENLESYPNIYGISNSRSSLSIFGTKFSLPLCSTRDIYPLYEEITVQPPNKAQKIDNKIIFIKEMNNLCSKSFQEYQTLNYIQSLIYPIAYETNENMLICAPTGAGKTDIAILAIMRVISQFSDPSPYKEPKSKNFKINKSEFKVIYISPMKALASEIVKKIKGRLSWLNIQVQELTGDIQLTKSEIISTQILVTTPEKWDIMTRKNVGDIGLTQKVKLMIFDEIHMLHDERGTVIETLIARTQRYIESSQTMIRIIGLSATLPNYIDVARFLGVNCYHGLFYFSDQFRSVPLEQHFLGVKGKPGSKISSTNMNLVTYEKVIQLVKNNHQVMVFVHTRKETAKTAKTLLNLALNDGYQDIFNPSNHTHYNFFKKDISKSKNKEMKELLEKGFGIHNAGMLRSDRNIVEKYFSIGIIRILCCTATLAWGVNLPAYAVIIKGTQIYEPQKGIFVDLGILDVLQIFGRAGRPQYEDRGIGYIITSNDKLAHYVSSVTQQHPIESKFMEKLTDNLNAEISLGSVTNVEEAISWLSYTYFYIRMKKNPLIYGLTQEDIRDDPQIYKRRKELIISAAKKLYETQMIIFNKKSGFLSPKDLGRIASNYYISRENIENFNLTLKSNITEEEVFHILSKSSEFSQMKYRENENEELKQLLEKYCHYKIKETIDSTPGKVNILLQSYISKALIEDSALISDSNYIATNASRICRALFEIALSRNWESALTILSVCKSIERQIWSYEHPLSQFNLPTKILQKLEMHNNIGNMEDLKRLSKTELGMLIHHIRLGGIISNYINKFPLIKIDAKIFPITKKILRIQLNIQPNFIWDNTIHNLVELFWIWVEDSDSTEILHSLHLLLSKKKKEETLDFVILLPDIIPSQILIWGISDKWLKAETMTPISLNNIVFPDDSSSITELLDLQPLPISALNNHVLEEIYSKKFIFFNAIQTQIFHTLYHTNINVLIGAPTGSGKTIAAELSLWWAFKTKPSSKIIYIAPMKALVRERVKDWTTRFANPLKKKIIELTGDTSPDSKEIYEANIIITTPEKWDGISRNWKKRKYVQEICLIIIDEIHLLGDDRGPILEIIVSRMNYIATQNKSHIRIIGLSTAITNALDLADWLSIKEEGLYNFRHSVRPIPLKIYIDGFSGHKYCQRMASMNKSVFSAILDHSPDKPVLIFVSSRRQTRLTSQDLITYCGLEENPKRFLHMSDHKLNMILTQVKDESLKNALNFGIGLHHAGLTENDRKLSEELFINNKIQILIATSTLAWGINTPTHLVIVKGTEFFDAKTQGYKDMNLTDVLQMLGRAGRPQFDTAGIAKIFVQDTKKSFYKHFLHEGFPVESSLHKVLTDHISAEIVNETISSEQDAIDYLTWTYFFRRIHKNPTYYGLSDSSQNSINTYLSKIINTSINELIESNCIYRDENGTLKATVFGSIASYYYISHKTIRNLLSKIKIEINFKSCLKLLSEASEFDELSVRHNEDIINKEISQKLPFKSEEMALPLWDPHVKTFLLIQAHLKHFDLPIIDYITDTISILDQSVRILQAYIDISTELGYLETCLEFISLLQCIKHARWPELSELSILPGVNHENAMNLQQISQTKLEFLPKKSKNDLEKLGLLLKVPKEKMIEFINVAKTIPIVTIEISQKEKSFLNITLIKDSKPYHPNYILYSPKFPKPQKEGWYILCTSHTSNRIHVLKRLTMSKHTHGILNTNIIIPQTIYGEIVNIIVISDTFCIKKVHSITLMS
ncbi:hypothetical protein PNEG_02184 [Pneumocystis murina B123]|uniref:U5 small nuclear ribonucleoprotein 200 kDa helicase n=1 Tax=Pneumocystis murina (strain B123) TaxID=1069680 RepID=M7P6T7_PNEMU|nr:hypothetical protein PNEG_02184 [Pneumocystis murina B123]EMR09600.1 hypothetical protein PNEG_02184 [Pneumocystis murina B123]